MKIGIIGNPQVGKTTLFKLLTKIDGSGNINQKANIGIAKVPDSRIDFLSGIFQPKKTTYATIELVDMAGTAQRPDGKKNELLEAIRDVDAIVQVVRAFESNMVPNSRNNIEPFDEVKEVQEELLLSDWSILENRLERIQKQKNKGANQNEGELEVLLKARDLLEQELPLRNLELTEQEEKLIRGYDFLTRKPIIVVVNLDEDQLRNDQYPQKAELEKWCSESNIPLTQICGQLEVEIAQLDEESQQLFMEELGIQETGIARLARILYRHLGLISFFTVGQDEVRAWTITDGSTAKEAAGKIHSDIERGFIRAEVVSYADFVEYQSMSKIKEKGLFRLEGKEYLVKDGDIISFRFNV